MPFANFLISWECSRRKSRIKYLQIRRFEDMFQRIITVQSIYVNLNFIDVIDVYFKMGFKK
jgi:hypothetical protein